MAELPEWTKVGEGMRFAASKAPLIALLALLLIFLPVTAADISIGKVVPRQGVTRVNGVPIALEMTLFVGDQLVTEADGAAIVVIPGGGQIHVGPSSAVVFYSHGSKLAVDLAAGVARGRAGENQEISINVRGLVVQASGAVSFEVGIDGESVLVAARSGSVDVVGTNTAMTIPAGSVMRFETAAVADIEDSREGEDAFVWTPANAVWVAVLVSAGISIPVGYLLADQLADDAAVEGCRRALKAISPSINLDACDIPS